MNISKFTGNNMREALQIVRDELGPDALILGTSETADGIEVVAALDYDPEAFALAAAEIALENVPAEPAEASAQEAGTDDATAADEDSRVAKGADAAQAPDAAPAAGAGAALERMPLPSRDLDQMREEVKSIRSLMESHLARAQWNETSIGSPIKAGVMRNLSALGLAPDIVRKLVDGLGDTNKVRNTWAEPITKLIEAIPCWEDDVAARGGIFAIVGPTGVGKTTSIGKLAARFAIENAASDMALVSIDNCRIGAREQVEAFGQIIGVPVYGSAGDRGIDDVLPLIPEKRLVLVDTVGMGQHDRRLTEQLRRLRASERAVTTLLAAPANLEHDALQEIFQAYAPAKPAGCILTKVDETASLGPALSVLIRSGLALAYIANGQRVPEDLHPAASRKTWLIKQAVEMMRTRRFSVSNRYMAESFFAAPLPESA